MRIVHTDHLAQYQCTEEGYFRRVKLAVDRLHLMADDTFFPPVILIMRRSLRRVPDKFRERQWTRIVDDATTLALQIGSRPF